MTAWGQVHAGDVVRGPDQRPWTVIEVGSPDLWVIDGPRGRFWLRHDDEVRPWRPRLTDGVELVERADHSDAARAFDVLSAAGMQPSIMEERVSGDPFTPPAPRAEPKIINGRYQLPDPETGELRLWTRATTVAKVLADDFGLVQWQLRCAVKGIALRPDLIASAAAADPDEDKSTLNSIAKQAMEATKSKSGANLGTAFHNFAKRVDRGEPLERMAIPSPLDQDILTYQRLKRNGSLSVEDSERVVLLPEWGIAGQLDRIVRQPSGVTHSAGHAILDLKTGKDLSYSWLEILIQLAIYSRARYLWSPGAAASPTAPAEYAPMPPVDQHRGLVAWVPIGRPVDARLYGVDLIRGWRWFELAMQARQARAEARKSVWLVTPQAPADVAVERVRKADSRDDLARLWDELYPKGLWTAEVDAVAQEILTRSTVHTGGTTA